MPTIVHQQNDQYGVRGDGTLSFSVTSPGGSNLVCIVSLGWTEGFIDNYVLGSLDYNASAMNEIGTEHDNGSGSFHIMAYVVDPASGSNTVEWDLLNALNETACTVNVDWFTNVDQTTPIVGPETQSKITGAFSEPNHTALTAGADEILYMCTAVDQNSTFPSGDSNVTLNPSIYQTANDDQESQTGYTTLDGHDLIGYNGNLSGNWASTAVVLNASVAATDPHILFEKRLSPLILI